ncbi:MAG TPA: hypothetical protein VJS44_03880 [Pyrinomonadaceae bacterium]|nr:hypothetical protein [Pyrinomonadaceae bacterium]
MRAKSGCLLLLVAASLLLAGCRREAEVNSALAELDAFTTEIDTRVRTNPTTEGLDAAQQYLDSRKREMKAKVALLTGVRGIQVSDETERRLIETVRRNQMTIIGLQSLPIAPTDAAFKTKLDKLINDYLSLFQA